MTTFWLHANFKIAAPESDSAWDCSMAAAVDEDADTLQRTSRAALRKGSAATIPSRPFSPIALALLRSLSQAEIFRFDSLPYHSRILTSSTISLSLFPFFFSSSFLAVSSNCGDEPAMRTHLRSFEAAAAVGMWESFESCKRAWTALRRQKHAKTEALCKILICKTIELCSANSHLSAPLLLLLLASVDATSTLMWYLWLGCCCELWPCRAVLLFRSTSTAKVVCETA